MICAVWIFLLSLFSKLEIWVKCSYWTHLPVALWIFVGFSSQPWFQYQHAGLVPSLAAKLLLPLTGSCKFKTNFCFMSHLTSISFFSNNSFGETRAEVFSSPFPNPKLTTTLYLFEQDSRLTFDVLVVKRFALLKLYLSVIVLPGSRMSTSTLYSGSLALIQYSELAWYTIMVAWRRIYALDWVFLYWQKNKQKIGKVLLHRHIINCHRDFCFTWVDP